MLKVNNIFPVYKDLEPLKQYNFETIEELHKTIIILLNDLNEHIISKELQLQLFQLKQESGLNINNFVNTFDFDVTMIRQKCLLYLSYLEFFHNIHTKHFKRFAKKMKLMNDYLDEDITFDESIQHNNEDDSVRSRSSNSSISSTIDTTDTTISYNSPSPIIPGNKNPPKSFETNILKITKPSNNVDQNMTLTVQDMTLTVQDIDANISQPNIKDMLNTLTDTCNEVLGKNIILVEPKLDETSADIELDDMTDVDNVVINSDKKKRKRNKKKK
jgi:hypothetical protein